MKRILRSCCAALLTCLTINAASAVEKVVYLKDFLTPGAAEIDAVPAVRAALEHCAATGARKLVLPGGRLCMRPDQAVEKYQFISNNDESLKRIAFDLAGMRDFEIDGGGTELLFTGFISPFSLEDCENITISDLTIDFIRTFHSEGIVEATGDGWLEIRFPEDYLCDIVNGCLRFRDTEGTVYPFSNLLEFDAVRREPAFRAMDYWLSNRTIPAEKCENGNFRILRKDLKATVGNVMVFGAAARYNPGFTLADCRGVEIRNVNLYHCGGMGVIAQRSRDNGRTPMQWDASANAGFTTGTPWIGTADNYQTINAAAEMDDPDSVRSFYKTLVHLRKQHKVISEGKIEFLFPENADLLAYRRYGAPDGEELLVLCNLTAHEVPVTLPEGWAGVEKLLGNYTETAAALRPYECTVLKR